MTDHDLSASGPSQLPEDAAWLFPEYEAESIRLDSHQGVILERILEKGSWAQLRWLFATYGEATVAEWVSQHGFRLLSRRSFALWRLALGVEDYRAPGWAVAAKDLWPW